MQIQWCIQINCNFCGESFLKYKGHVNRALKNNQLLFCDKICLYLHRKSFKKPESEKKKEKSEYDKIYKLKNKERDAPKRAAYHKKTYNVEKEREKRKKKMHLHVKYCQQPKYKQYKREYDKKYRAKKNYGEFWEASLMLNDLEQVVDNKMAKQDLNLINKSQKRKRQWQRKSSLQTI